MSTDPGARVDRARSRAAQPDVHGTDSDDIHPTEVARDGAEGSGRDSREPSLDHKTETPTTVTTMATVTPVPTMTDVKQALEGGDGVVDVEMDPPKLDPWTPVGHHHSPAHIREPDGEVVTFPDGGVRAWLVVAGAGHVLFATFGFVNAWGLFQEYYTTHLFPERTASEVAWIGSLQYLLIYLPSVLMGRLVDTSRFYYPFWAASVLYPVSVFLTAQVKEYWQAVLAHGLMFGGTAGMLFCPAIAVVTQWFYHRRALALGIVACCSSLGGTFFPIVVHNCLPKLGFQWTMRLCGFLLLYCCAIGCLALRTRLPPKAAPGGIFNWGAFKVPSFSFFVLGSLLIQGGLYIPLSYVDVMGKRLGLGEYATYLVAIANATSAAGRLGPALFADHTGSLNILIPGLLGSAATTFAWPFCTSKASLTAIAAVNGVFQGCYVSLLAPAAAALGGIEDVGRRFGMVSSVMALGSLLGAPVSGAILDRADFHAVSYYAGAIIIAGAAAMATARTLHLKGFWGKM